jgi:WS/DGAT/MGAT family acyltransferase
MQRLTGADATFLYGETRAAPLEIATCLVVDARDAPRGEDLLARARAYLEPRLHLAPLLRRRLVRVPFELEHPLWIEDPDFDIDHHLRHIAVPQPGRLDQLGDVVGRLLSRPLDHSRPLWELYLIEGLADDRAAIFVKTHHAAVDGVAAFGLVAATTDLEPDAPPPPPPDEPWRPDAAPSDLSLVAHAFANLATQPLRGLKAARRIARTVVHAQRDHGGAAAAIGAFGAPATRFNDVIGPHRAARFFDLPLDEVKKLKADRGVKLNDVVLGVVAGGLRRYLLRHDELPMAPLVAFVPVSVRGDGPDSGDAGNSTAMVHVELATDTADPGVRLQRIADAMVEAKARFADLGPSPVVDLTEPLGTPLAYGAFRLAETLRLVERTRLGGNVVVSNIPGPPVPLYTSGMCIERMYPVGPLAQGAGLNITLLSYVDQLCFAAVADRDLVPDLDDLVEDLRAGFEELRG